MSSPDDVIYTTPFWMQGQRVEVSLTVAQMEAAIADFVGRTEAYAAFQRYVEQAKAYPHQHCPIDGFDTALREATDEAAGHGAMLWYRVWEELLNRHGLPTNWSGGAGDLRSSGVRQS